MINRIKEIKNIGTFEDGGNGRIELLPHTYILAPNTYGKTTFCDIMRSFKTNDISYILKRRRLGTNSKEKCIVSLTINNSNVKFDGDKWDVPPEADIRETVEIFDINFVNENVFTNFKVEHKNKEELTSFILGKRGVELIQTLSDYEKLLTEKEQLLKEKLPKFEKSLNGYSFDEIASYSYDEDFKDIECLIISANENIKKYKEQQTKISEIKSIPQIAKLTFDCSQLYNIINDVKELCNIKCDINLTELKYQVEQIRIDKPAITDQWIKIGIQNAKNTCPFCGNDITNNNQIKIFSEYFSEFIVSILDKIETNNHLGELYY